MFIILDGKAEFTVDGRTSVLEGPAGVPDRMGHAHAIYNPTDQPLQWLNINVGMSKVYDTFNLGDSHVNATIDPVPQFISFRLDRSLLRPVNAMDGGTGTVQYRRALGAHGLLYNLVVCRSSVVAAREFRGAEGKAGFR